MVLQTSQGGAMALQNLTDEQRAFVESIRDVAARECGTREQRNRLTDHGRDPHNQDVYERVADLGWIGVSIPEQQISADWGLELGEPYLPGGQCAWVAPARRGNDEELVLKVGWRHREAEHEADALRFWDGNDAVRCLATTSLDDTTALLLERCVPGVPLKCSLAEPEQDVVVAGLMRRLWERTPGGGHPFGSLQRMCDSWAEWFEQGVEADARGLDPGLAREGVAMLRDLPRTADRSVLLCTDLHGENVLSAQREPWLVIDPKPFLAFRRRSREVRPR